MDIDRRSLLDGLGLLADAANPPIRPSTRSRPRPDARRRFHQRPAPRAGKARSRLMTKLSHILFATLALAAAPLAPATAAGPAVQATDAWCRATPTGALAGGCFVTLTAARADRLVAVSSPASNHGEIHTMEVVDGVMRMRQLADGIELPAGQPVALRPGARHLMLIGLKGPLQAGDHVALTLRFQSGGQMTVQAEVRAAPRPGRAS